MTRNHPPPGWSEAFMLRRAIPRLLILWGVALLALAVLDAAGYRAFLLKALVVL